MRIAKSALKLLHKISFLIAICFCAPASAQTNDVCALLDSHTGWSADLNQASDKWGISKGAILAIIDQESRFRATVSNGVNYGYAQSNPQTWRWFARDAGMSSASRTNFGDSAHFIGWHFKTMSRRLGLSMDNVAGQYLAYKMGEGGYRSRGNSGGSAHSRQVAARAARFNGQLESCE